MVPALGGSQITFLLPNVTSVLVCVKSKYEIIKKRKKTQKTQPSPKTLTTKEIPQQPSKAC